MSECLHEQRLRFRQRNTFLQASLGLLAVARRLEPLLDSLLSQPSGPLRAAPPDTSTAPASPAAAAESETQDGLLVYALLGAISLARQLQAEAAAHALPPDLLPARVPSNPPASVRERVAAHRPRELAR